MAGITNSDLRPEHFVLPEKGREIILFLERYENALETEKLIDTPGLYGLAASLAGDRRPGASRSGSETLYLCPRDISLSLREKEFLEKVAGLNLILVPGDPVFGLERPRLRLRLPTPNACLGSSSPKPPRLTSGTERSRSSRRSARPTNAARSCAASSKQVSPWTGLRSSTLRVASIPHSFIRSPKRPAFP